MSKLAFREDGVRRDQDAGHSGAPHVDCVNQRDIYIPGSRFVEILCKILNFVNFCVNTYFLYHVSMVVCFFFVCVCCLLY